MRFNSKSVYPEFFNIYTESTDESIQFFICGCLQKSVNNILYIIGKEEQIIRLEDSLQERDEFMKALDVKRDEKLLCQFQEARARKYAKYLFILIIVVLIVFY